MNRFRPILTLRGALHPLRQFQFGRTGYANRLKSLFGSSIISYLPLWEPGGSVAFDYSGNERNGAYTAVTLGQPGIGDGRSAASFNGSTSYCNWYSAALASAFNGPAGTLMVWSKAANTGVWTDGISRTLARIRGAIDQIHLWKWGGDNNLYWTYDVNGVVDQASLTVTTINWFHAAMTWSLATDEMKRYYNGTQEGATLTGLGVWTQALDPTTTIIGAGDTTTTLNWSGLLAHAVLLNRAATAAEIQEAYRIAF